MFLTTFLSLISVINPLGTIPIFLGLTQELDKDDLKKTALKSSFISTIILYTSFVFGTYILSFFNISIMSLKIAGGIIISMSGYSLMTGHFVEHKGLNSRVKKDAFSKDDPSFTPLAIPMLAGPGSMSYLISLKSKHHILWEHLEIFLCILLTGIVIFLVLSSARWIHRALGASGLSSLSRVIGFIVIAIGIEYMASGLTMYLGTL